MPDRLQVPRIAQILGPAINAWVAARPSVLQHINLDAGRYADIVAGWEGQVNLLVRQIADEVVSARLGLSAGVALTQTAASEWFTNRTTGKTAAVGRVRLTRTGTAIGVTPKDFRFRRPAAPTFNPPIPAAAYVAQREVSWGQGVTSVSVPIVASLPGSASNAPYFEGDNTGAGAAPLGLEDTPFDSSIVVAGYEAAGGTDGESDDDLTRAARANAVGNAGPTRGAILSAALASPGVHRAAVFDVAQAIFDANGNAIPAQPVAYTGVALADPSWASGYPGLPAASSLGVWEGTVAQTIADTKQGVGGQVLCTGVNNLRIRLDALFNLRSGDDLHDTSAIDAAVLTTARSYFDDRPDWWTWTTRGLRAWLSRAHPKILSCASVTVTSFAGAVLAQPGSTSPQATLAGLNALHYLLVQNGVSPTYQAAA